MQRSCQIQPGEQPAGSGSCSRRANRTVGADRHAKGEEPSRSGWRGSKARAVSQKSSGRGHHEPQRAPNSTFSAMPSADQPDRSATGWRMARRWRRRGSRRPHERPRRPQTSSPASTNSGYRPRRRWRAASLSRRSELAAGSTAPALPPPARTARRRPRPGSDRASDSDRAPSAMARAHHGVDCRFEPLPVAGADQARRGDERAPVLELDVHALLAQGGDIEPGEALGARDRERAHGARRRSAPRTRRDR